VDTDIPETRKKLIGLEDATEFYMENMTGCLEVVSNVKGCITVDHSAIKPHEDKWKKMLGSVEFLKM
jgi:hypothetical protein